MNTLSALLWLASPANAWEHTYTVWLPEDFPLPYWVADDETSPNSIERCEASGGLEGCCEETVPTGYCKQVSAEGFDAWKAASCAEFDVEYQGVCPNGDFAYDSQYRITFNQEPDLPGALAVTYSVGGEFAFTLDGSQYERFSSTDIVFSKDVEFTTNEKVVSNECQDEFNMRSVMTHEMGHSLGMDHSCEDPNKGGLPCTDPVKLAATMFWNEGPCQVEAVDINEDDIEGFTALYGPFATFQCSHQVGEDLAVGIVPFDLHCVIVSDYLSEVVSAEWNFGDGGTASTQPPNLAATHTYEEPGNYTIQVTVNGEREACGEEGWQNNYRRVGYVRACGIPDAAFTVEHVDGLGYQMLNESDVSVYGCISNVEWQVFKGEGTSGEPIMADIAAWEPVINFPEPGTYTVVMNLGGIAGTGAAAVTFEAKDKRGVGQGCGCDQTTAPLGAVSLLMLAAGIATRRR